MKRLSEFYSVIKNSTNAKSVEEIIWVILGQGFNVILSLIIIKILSQMGPNDYGVYTLIITIAALLGLLFGSFQQGFIRYFYDYKNENKEDVFVNLFFKFLTVSVFFLLCLILIFSITSVNYLKDYSTLFLISAGLMVVTTKVSELFNSWFNILRKRKINTILLSGEKGLIILFLILLIINDSLLLGNVINFIFISTLIFIVIKVFNFKNFIHATVKINKSEIKYLQKDMRKRVWIYATPFLIWAVAGWLQLNGEKWIINGILSVKEVGIYAIMMAIVNALVVIPSNVINEFATPIIYQNYADLENIDNLKKGYLYIKIIMVLVFILSVFSTVITYFFAKDIIILISSNKYIDYWYLLPLLTFGTGLFYTGQTQTILGMALDKPQKYLFPKILIGLLAVGFNLLFIKTFGLNGVAYTIIIIGFFYAIHIYFINLKIENSFYKHII